MIITRKEAREQGLTRYFTGKPCKRGHICERRVCNALCIECASEYSKSYTVSYYLSNKDRIDSRNRDRYLLNKESIRESNRLYYLDNSESIKARNKLYRDEHPDVMNALYAKRRAAKLQRTPDWLTEDHYDQIKSIYKEASTLDDHHVDHIVPLQGELVSGLHVPWNLQILTAEENLMKSNKYEVV